MERALIYSRVSTDAQERDGTSLETQERACLEQAAASGWLGVKGAAHRQRELHRKEQEWYRRWYGTFSSPFGRRLRAQTAPERGAESP